MWALILGGLVLGSALGVIYIVIRFTKFRMIRKAAGGRKLLFLLLGALPVAAIVLGTNAALGAINAEIVVLHLTVIWMLCDGIGWIAKKVRRKRETSFMENGENASDKPDFERGAREASFTGNRGHASDKPYRAGGFALGITAVYLICGWYLANHVWRTPYTVETDKPVGSLRIVQFADSHVGNTFSGEGLARWAEDMQAENPDIVVITGDYVDDDTSLEDMTAACRVLGTLRTTYGVYYVFGNHDKGYYEGYRGYSGSDLVAELEKNNITVLQDDTVLLGEHFYLIGRKDRSEEQAGWGRASMTELTADLDPDKFSIVLDHQPYDYEAQEAAGVDLVLSGHTHGGQLIPLNRMGEWLGLDDKIYGLEKRGDTSFVVTSGISDWKIQFKTGCRSEYTVIDVTGPQ